MKELLRYDTRWIGLLDFTGRLHRSNDSGAHWTDMKLPVLAYDAVGAVGAVDAEVTWVLADENRVGLTRDGGATWHYSKIASSRSAEIVGWDASQATLLTLSEILSTRDAGLSWSRSAPKGYCPAGVRPIDASTIWRLRCRSEGAMQTLSGDAGATWDDVSIPSTVLPARDDSAPHGVVVLDAFDARSAVALYAYHPPAEEDHDTPTLRRFVTVDAGRTWLDQGSVAGGPQHYQYADLEHVARWAAPGDEGGPQLQASPDGGSSWYDVALPAVGSGLGIRKALVTVDARVVMLDADNRLRWTDDAGRTWHEDFVGEPRNTLKGVHFFDRREGLAVGDSAVLRTRDGGVSWQTLAREGKTMDRLQFVAGGSRGWAISGNLDHSGSATLVRSDDRGLSWTDIVSPLVVFTGFHFLDARHGWACGVVDNEAGTGIEYRAYQTADEGASWSRIEGLQGRCEAIHFFDARDGVAVLSTDDNLEGFVVRTDDAGKTWTRVANHTKRYFKLTQVDPDTVLAYSDEGMLRSADRGQHWSAVALPGGRGPSSVEFATPGIGIAGVAPPITSEYDFARGGLLASKDGGKTWQQQVNDLGAYPAAVAMVDARNAWAVGPHGSVLRTTTGGW